jgi:hypothetical protein
MDEGELQMKISLRFTASTALALITGAAVLHSTTLKPILFQMQTEPLVSPILS